ncbi:MAG: glycosyltransferase involved in cell wall biosynthesis [Parvicellaceae bacterium]
MNTKKNILIFVDWFLPGKNAGGPIRSVANIIKRFESDFNFKVVTSAFDFGANGPYAGILQDQWTDHDGIKVWYCSKPPSIDLIRTFITSDVDVVYMNSLFSKPYTQLPLRAIKKENFQGKVILAPRGMLGAGALEIKATKKKAFLKAARIFRWYKRVIWHASTEQEQKEIHKYFGEKSKVFVAENLASLPDLKTNLKPIKVGGEAIFVFVSRISVKKNLLFWIDLLSKINAEQLTLKVIGPVEDDAYWKECKTKFSEFNSNFKLHYLGSMEHDDVLLELNSSHFFVLPTLHENYGHVIVEALAMGCPVLVSDQTPWRKLKELGIGSDISLSNSDLWISETQRLIDIEEEDYLKDSASSASYAKEKLQDQSIINKNRSLFGE